MSSRKIKSDNKNFIIQSSILYYLLTREVTQDIEEK